MMVTLLEDENGTPTSSSVLDQALAKQVMSALADDVSRKIIASVVAKGKTVQEISAEQSIALSTCYRRSRTLVDQGILFVERIVVTGDGKRYALLRSSLKSVDLSSNFQGLTVKAEMLDGVFDRFRLRRLSLPDLCSRSGAPTAI